MKSKPKTTPRQFKLEILTYGNSYYNDRIVELERALAKESRRLQLDLIGAGEIPADAALHIRAALLARSLKIRLNTHAHSSLQNGSVLVWLLGERQIRDDATVYFRRADLSEVRFADPDEIWREEEPQYRDSYTYIDPEEGDYARVLQLINEFLPVIELADRLVGVPVLRQFGLVEHTHVGSFLTAAFAKSEQPKSNRTLTPR